MKAFSRTLAAIVGFLLPWQTRWIFVTPLVGGVVWDLGIISLYVSQLVLVVWLAQETWLRRAEINWFGQWRWPLVVTMVVALTNILGSSNKILALLSWGGIFLLLGLGVLLWHDHSLLKPFLGGIFISATMQALLGLLQVCMNNSFASKYLGIAARQASDAGVAVVVTASHRYLRAYGGMPHPNIFGGFLLASILWYGQGLASGLFKALNKNIVQFTAALTAAFFFTFSRAAWSGMVIAGIIFLIKRRLASAETILFWKTIAITFGILLIIFAPMVWSRTQVVGGVEQRSVEERLAQIITWKKVFAANWWRGVGLGNYTAKLNAPIGNARQPVHVAPLLALAELGVVAAALLLLLTKSFWPRSRIFWLTLLPFVPALLVDHYLWSLWAGLFVLFLAVFLAQEKTLDKI